MDHQVEQLLDLGLEFLFFRCHVMMREKRGNSKPIAGPDCKPLGRLAKRSGSFCFTVRGQTITLAKR